MQYILKCHLFIKDILNCLRIKVNKCIIKIFLNIFLILFQVIFTFSSKNPKRFIVHAPQDIISAVIVKIFINE